MSLRTSRLNPRSMSQVARVQRRRRASSAISRHGVGVLMALDPDAAERGADEFLKALGKRHGYLSK